VRGSRKTLMLAKNVSRHVDTCESENPDKQKCLEGNGACKTLLLLRCTIGCTNAKITRNHSRGHIIELRRSEMQQGGIQLHAVESALTLRCTFSNDPQCSYTLYTERSTTHSRCCMGRAKKYELTKTGSIVYHRQVLSRRLRCCDVAML
jgi:hypothetical protein